MPNTATVQPSNAQPSKDGPVSVNVTMNYYDYSEPTGSDTACISGTRRDVGLILSKLHGDACISYSFKEAGNSEYIPPSTFTDWVRASLPPVPSNTDR